MCAAGLLLVAAALVVIAQLSHTSPYWQLAAGLLMLGVGMGAAMTPATAQSPARCPAQARGRLRGQRPVPRGRRRTGHRRHRQRHDRHLPGPPHGARRPAAVLGEARDSVAVAAHIGGPVAAQADTAFIDGVHIALYTAAGAAALAAIVVFGMLCRHTRKPYTADTSRETDELPATKAEVLT